jgi:hypothetical protein
LRKLRQRELDELRQKQRQRQRQRLRLRQRQIRMQRRRAMEKQKQQMDEKRREGNSTNCPATSFLNTVICDVTQCGVMRLFIVAHRSRVVRLDQLGLSSSRPLDISRFPHFHISTL